MLLHTNSNLSWEENQHRKPLAHQLFWISTDTQTLHPCKNPLNVGGALVNNAAEKSPQSLLI